MAEDGEDGPPDPFGDEETATGIDADADADTGDGRERTDAPLDDLAREVREKRAARESRSDAALDADPDPELADDLFESVEVDHVDDDAVWESFVEGETGPEERVGLGADAERAADPAEHVVPKRDFCQRCPHFADPPETACTHEGTDIVEVVDADRFRVRNCPVVEEDAAERVD